MKRVKLFALISLLFIGLGHAWGEITISYGWEDALDANVWEQSNLSNGKTYSTYKKSGSYAASTGSTTSAYIKTKEKIASPKSATCYYTKASSNTNSSSKFIIQISTDGSEWTDVATGNTMNNVTQGTFYELTAELSSYSDVYIRFYYTGTNAARVIDDVSITSSGGVTYTDYLTECSDVPTYTAKVADGIGNGEILISSDLTTWSGSVGGLSEKQDVYFIIKPKTDYVVESYSISPTGTITDMKDTYDGYAIYGFQMPAEDVTVSATFTCPTVTLTFQSPNGTETRTVSKCAAIGENLPAAPDACSGTYSHFVGWFTDAAGSDDSPSNAPQGTRVTAETVPAGNATYYAVFSDASGEAEWTLVTSTAELVAGGTYTIASSSTTKSGKALGTQNTNNRAAVEWNNTNPTELTLGGNAIEGWTFYDETEKGYLYAASSSDNYLRTQTNLDDNGKWTIAIAASGSAATIKAKGTNTRNLLKFNPNNGNPLFSCYESGQSAVYLFHLASPATGYISSCCTDAAEVTITPTSTNLNLKGGNSVSTSVICSQEGGGTGKWTYSVSPSDGATFDGTTFTATKAGTYTLTATYTENCGKSATATITIIDNPIYTVTWSVDGTPTDTRQYNSGEALVLPETTPSGCGDKVFVGWTANSAYDNATTAPSDLFTEAKGTVTADANYYAVFAKKVTVDTQVKSKTLEITIDNFKEITTSYTKIYTQAYADHNTSVEAYGVYKSNNGIQMNSGKSTYIKNTIALAAPITNITCIWTAIGKNSPTLYVASDKVASKSSDNLGKQNNSITTQSVAVNPDGNYRYFYFDGTTVTGACYLTSLQITYGGSYSTYSEYTTSCSGRASMPVFRPASGATIQSGEKVVITCSTDGAAIHYTLDGSEPTAESALYAGDGVRISVQEAGSVTLKAIAIVDGMGTSYVATATYSVTLPAPTGVVLHANNDTDDYAAVSVAYGSSDPVCYFPTYADSIFLGFYTSATKGEGLQLYAADGTMVLNVEGYTDTYGWASLDSRIDLYAQWKKPEDIVVDENTTNLDIYPYDLSTTDIIITSTGTLTITKNERVHDVHVKSGGSLIINGGTLDVNSLHLYSGWQGDKTAYGVASVYIAPEASLSKTVQTVYLDLCIDNDHFYPLAVPFPVKICGTSESEANMQGYHVRYAEDWLNQYAKYRADGTGQVIIKRYDGAHRAETGKAEGNWVGVAYNETLQPSEGYIIRAVPVSGQDTAVIRIEMEVPDAWTTSGEQGTVENITRNQISVTAHGTDKPALDDTHKGWNMLGVPYLSYFGTQNWDGESSGIAGGKVVIQDGKIVLDDKTVRYVSVPTYDFSEYIQTPLSSTSLRPGWSFFVQIGTSGTLTFATTDREASSPLLAPAQSNSEQELTLLLSHGAKSDHTGLILSDAYTTDYEIGADLEKMFGEGFTLSVYTLSGNTRLAYNALSREAATQLIPIGFRAPEDGEYTFSLPEDSPTEGIERIERIDLIDYETGTLTNLLSAPYTFSTTRTESESRFAITITYSKETPTDTEAPFGKGNKRIEKVLIQQQLYIIIDGKMYDATGKKVNE